MRLTRAAEYAVRCIVYLAGNGHGKVVGRVKIAKAMLNLGGTLKHMWIWCRTYPVQR
jgi:hypothetical protein